MNKIAERALASNSNSVKRLNPHVFKANMAFLEKEIEPAYQNAPKPAKRIRQSNKPVMNKLEQEWFDFLSACRTHVGAPPYRAQAKKYQYGNGAWYKPDITRGANSLEGEIAYEVKGPKQMKGIARGMVVLKAAAHQWPEVRFILVWKEGNEWKEQVVLP